MPAHHPSLTAIRPWRYIPSVWDALIFALVLGLIALIAGLLVSIGLVQQEPEPPHG